MVKKKVLVAVAAVAMAAGLSCVGAFAFFTDVAQIHAGIKTTKLTGEISTALPVGTPDSGTTWRESYSTVKDGAAPVFSAYDTDVKDGLAKKADVKEFTVARGNALAVTAEGGINSNQAFSVTYKNSGTVDEKFYPEIRLTPEDGMNLSQYKDALGVTETNLTGLTADNVSYQDVIKGVSEESIVAKTYNIASAATKVTVNKDGTMSLFLPSITLKAGESVEKSYVLTENMSGHIDYSVPTVKVSVNATVRYANKGSALWYGGVTGPVNENSATYTLAPDIQTRVLWQDANGSYTVRGGADAFTVMDASSAKTAEALEYSVIKHEYSGTNQAPTAYLFGKPVAFTLYRQNDKNGKWVKVDDGNATGLGNYKAVVDASQYEGFAVSHCEYYFGVLKIKDTVTLENKPMPDGSVDTDNKMTWPQINDGEKVYDGKPISIIAKDSHGNLVPDLIFTREDTGAVVANPTDVGNYIVTPVSDEFHEYTNTGKAKITPASLVIKADDLKVDDGVKPTFTSTKTGFVNGETDAVLGGAAKFTIYKGSNVVVPDTNGCYPPDTYEIMVGGYTSTNYDIKYERGTLVVDYPEADVQLSLTGSVTGKDKSKVYDSIKVDNSEVNISVDAGASGLPTGYELVWRNEAGYKIDNPLNVGTYTAKVEKVDKKAKTWKLLGNEPVTYTITPFKVLVSVKDFGVTDRGGYKVRMAGDPIVHNISFENSSSFPAADKDTLMTAKDALLGIKSLTDCNLPAQYKYFYNAKTLDANRNGSESVSRPSEAYYLSDGTLGSIEGRLKDKGTPLFNAILNKAASQQAGFDRNNYSFEWDASESVYTVATLTLDYNAEDAKKPSGAAAARDKILIEPVKGYYDEEDMKLLDSDMPERDGYICQGFATSKYANKATIVAGDVLPQISENTTVYAVWQEIPKPYIVYSSNPSSHLRNFQLLSDKAQNTAVQSMAQQMKAVRFDDSVPDGIAWTPIRTNDAVVVYLDDDLTLHICNNQNVTGKIQPVIAEPHALSDFFQGCNNLTTVDMSGLDTSEVVSLSGTFASCKNLVSVKGFTENTHNLKGMSGAFQDCPSLTDISGLKLLDTSRVEDLRDTFAGCSSLENLEPLSDWDVSRVETMANMFGEGQRPDNAHLDKLKSVHGIENWKTDSLTNTDSMFQGAAITDITPLKDWNFSKVTSVARMFSRCENLVSAAGAESWDVSNLQYGHNLFSGDKNLVDISALSNWNTARLVSMSSMFSGCSSLQSCAALKNWDTSNVEQMKSLFSGCTSLTDVSGLTNFNTGKVVTMTWMFYDCTSLEDISALSNWDTSSNKTLALIFENCSKLSDITPLENWNTAAVTTMTSAFDNTAIDNTRALKNWNTSEVTDMTGMFYACKNLTTLEGLENWDTSKVTLMGRSNYESGGMFRGCSKLSDITPLANWQVGAVADLSCMFRDCAALTDATTLNNWNLTAGCGKENMFYNTAVPSDKLPSWY